MGKRLISITFYVTLQGMLWQGIDANKETQAVFTPEKQPFCNVWHGLRDALSIITDDGDFQYCSISWATMVIRWYDGKYFVEYQADVPDCKLTKEFLLEE